MARGAISFVRYLFGPIASVKRSGGDSGARGANPTRPPPPTNTRLDGPRDDEQAPVQLQYNSDRNASVAPEVRQCNVKATLDGNRENGPKNAACDSVSEGRQECKMLDTQEVMF